MDGWQIELETQARQTIDDESNSLILCFESKQANIKSNGIKTIRIRITQSENFL